ELDRAAVVWLHVGDLRAEVHGEAAEREERLGGDTLRHAHHLVVGHPELRGLLTGLGVGVGLGGDIRIHTDAEIGPLLQLVRDGDYDVELRGRFDVEKPYADPDRLFELERRLADAREHDRGRVEPG